MRGCKVFWYILYSYINFNNGEGRLLYSLHGDDWLQFSLLFDPQFHLLLPQKESINMSESAASHSHDSPWSDVENQPSVCKSSDIELTVV